MKHARSLMLVLLLLISLSPLGEAPIGRTPVAQAAQRPNIIFILTDDLDMRVFNRMPRLESLLTEQGTTFTNNFVSLSLCCPSRTTILRGQYAHNTRVFTNALPGGGFQKVFNRGLESSTFATWLQDAGYRTVLLGKYLNGYPGDAGATYIPPGWDEWYSPVGGVRYFGYRMNENGRLVDYGTAARDYLTDVLSRKANTFVRQTTAAGGAPFFMYITPYAPHGPATPAPRHNDTFPNAQAPRTPSFNEEDVSDKPAWVRNQPLLTRRQIETMDDLAQKRRQSMLAVEDLLESLIATLRNTGQLSNTYIFFSSDNGFHQGQHRLKSGKNSAFEEDLRVPLVVRGPGVPAGVVRRHLSVNIDLAPTFAELAGASIPSFVDGRSLVPLLRIGPPPVDSWRQGFLLEHGFPGDSAETGTESPDLELSDPTEEDEEDLVEPAAPTPSARLFQGLRSAARLTYIEYANGERELYDLTTDPDQLDNGYEAADPDLIARLVAWLNTLRHCAGATCRSAEDGPP
jgi:N-acetylglucosamine-6-sulfatase